MLQDLFLLRSYFEEPFTVMYEADLIEKYGAAAVIRAITDGLLEHRRVPCGTGRQRCVCRISEKGRKTVLDKQYSQ